MLSYPVGRSKLLKGRKLHETLNTKRLKLLGHHNWVKESKHIYTKISLYKMWKHLKANSIVSGSYLGYKTVKKIDEIVTWGISIVAIYKIEGELWPRKDIGRAILRAVFYFSTQVLCIETICSIMIFVFICFTRFSICMFSTIMKFFWKPGGTQFLTLFMLLKMMSLNESWLPYHESNW